MRAEPRASAAAFRRKRGACDDLQTGGQMPHEVNQSSKTGPMLHPRGTSQVLSARFALCQDRPASQFIEGAKSKGRKQRRAEREGSFIHLELC